MFSNVKKRQIYGDGAKLQKQQMVTVVFSTFCLFAPPHKNEKRRKRNFFCVGGRAKTRGRKQQNSTKPFAQKSEKGAVLYLNINYIMIKNSICRVYWVKRNMYELVEFLQVGKQLMYLYFQCF